jgi:hypothetical protein
MFTFEERYRPLRAGAKFVYLSRDFSSIDPEMKDIKGTYISNVLA